MNLLKSLVRKQSSSGGCLLCEVCGKQVKGSFKLSHDKSGIYMGPNGVVIHDFAAGRRGLCHNKCVKKSRMKFACTIPNRLALLTCRVQMNC
jgi:hypothetical protein